MPLVLRVAIKPTASIAKLQETVELNNRTVASLSVQGRHDTCIVPRAVVVVEAMMSIILCDFALRAQVIHRIIQ